LVEIPWVRSYFCFRLILEGDWHAVRACDLEAAGGHQGCLVLLFMLMFFGCSTRDFPPSLLRSEMACWRWISTACWSNKLRALMRLRRLWGAKMSLANSSFAT
jgi:hypothetical protein